MSSLLRRRSSAGTWRDLAARTSHRSSTRSTLDFRDNRCSLRRPESCWRSDWFHLLTPEAARLFTKHLLTFIHRCLVFHPAFLLSLLTLLFTETTGLTSAFTAELRLSGLIYHRFAPSDNQMRNLVLDFGRYRCSALIISLHEGFTGSQTHWAAAIISHISYL